MTGNNIHRPSNDIHNFINDIHNRWVCTSTLHTYCRFAPDYLTMKYTMHRMHARGKKTDSD